MLRPLAVLIAALAVTAAPLSSTWGQNDAGTTHPRHYFAGAVLNVSPDAADDFYNSIGFGGSVGMEFGRRSQFAVSAGLDHSVHGFDEDDFWTTHGVPEGATVESAASRMLVGSVGLRVFPVSMERATVHLEGGVALGNVTREFRYQDPTPGSAVRIEESGSNNLLGFVLGAGVRTEQRGRIGAFADVRWLALGSGDRHVDLVPLRVGLTYR
jgi:opacity protein-like surface antigen